MMSIDELASRAAPRPGAEVDTDSNREADSAALKKADTFIVAGALASGSFILGPVGIVLMLVGFLKLRRLAAAGQVTRPWLVTVMGVFCLVDAGINMIGWSVDLLLHDTGVGQTVFAGYGRLVDGGYYLGYNHLSFGGTPFIGEKILEVSSVVALFPIRIAAAWAFFRQKRWGLQYMILTSWMYMYLWIAYLFDKALTFPLRFGTTEAGLIGFWAFNVFYWTPFLMLPALYSLKRSPCWVDD
jgi:hypothetical protein